MDVTWLVGQLLASYASSPSLGLVTLARSTSSLNADIWFPAIREELGSRDSPQSFSLNGDTYTFHSSSFKAPMILAETPKICRINAILISRLVQTSQLTIFFAGTDFNFDDTSMWFPTILGSQFASNSIKAKFPRTLLVCLESPRLDGQVPSTPGKTFTTEELKKKLLPFAHSDLKMDVIVLPKVAEMQSATNHLRAVWNQEFAHLFENFLPLPALEFLDFANTTIQQSPVYTLPSYGDLVREAHSSKISLLVSDFGRDLDLIVKPFIDCDPPTFKIFIDCAVTRLLQYPYGQKLEKLPPNDQSAFTSGVDRKRTDLWVSCAQHYDEEAEILDDAYLRSVVFLMEHVRSGECKLNFHRECCLREFDKLIGQEVLQNFAAKDATREELATFAQNDAYSQLTQKTLNEVEKAQFLTGLLKEFNFYLNARFTGDKSILVNLCVSSIREAGSQANQSEEKIESTVSAFLEAVKYAEMPSPEPEHYHPPQRGRKKKGWVKWAAMVVSVALSVYMPMALGPLLTAKIGAFGSAIVTGALTEAVKNVATTSIMGGQIQGKQVFRSALMGAVSAGGAHMVGSAFGNQWSVGKSVSHGVVGGLASVAGGGKFGHGFVSAVVSDAVVSGIDKLRDSIGSPARHIGPVEKVFAGGSASAIAHLVLGGDEPLLAFAQGASTAYFNHVMHELDGLDVTQEETDEFYRTLQEDYAEQLVENPNMRIEEYLSTLGIDSNAMEIDKSPSSSIVADLADEAVYFVPIVGEIRSVWDAIQYLKAGDMGNAAWSLVGAIPIAGRIKRLTVASKVLSKERGAMSIKSALNKASEAPKAKAASSSSTSSKPRNTSSKPPKERPCDLNKEYKTQSGLRQAYIRRAEYEFSNPDVQQILTRTMSKRGIRACVNAVNEAKAAGKRHVSGLKDGGVPLDLCHNRASRYGGKNTLGNVHLNSAAFNRSEGSKIAKQGAKLDAAKGTTKPK